MEVGAVDSLLAKLWEQIFNPIIWLVAVIALAWFLWGLALFILNLGGKDDRKLNEGKRQMLWGIVGLFIIFSVWGIISVLQNTVDTF
jgi:hypothetical protein